MTTAYTHFLDLVREADPPADGILSKTIYHAVCHDILDFCARVLAS